MIKEMVKDLQEELCRKLENAARIRFGIELRAIVDESFRKISFRHKDSASECGVNLDIEYSASSMKFNKVVVTTVNFSSFELGTPDADILFIASSLVNCEDIRETVLAGMKFYHDIKIL